MKAHTQRVMHSSEKADWRTPGALFQALDSEFDFVIDIAADERSKLCTRWFGPGSNEAEDALAADLLWPSPGFVNPPYSLKLASKWQSERSDPVELASNPFKIENWVRKAHDQSRLKGWRGAMILPFSSQANWYRHWVCGHGDNSTTHAALEERRLIRRISFREASGAPGNSAPGNSVIVIWGPTWGYVGQVVPCVRYWDWVQVW